MHLFREAYSLFEEYSRIFRDPWRKWNHGQGIRVAVIDSGINLHLISYSMQRQIVLQKDFVSKWKLDGGRYKYKDRDAYFHGTICASLIASTAPKCELIDCRVAYSNCVAPSILATAIMWAATEGKAHVINVSVGTKNHKAAACIRYACQLAQADGSIIIASCPNRADSSLPSSLNEVISVEGIDLGYCGRWCHSSSIQNRIYCHSGPYKSKHYCNVNGKGIRGNSAATAVVSGQVARLLSSYQVHNTEILNLMYKHGAAIT